MDEFYAEKLGKELDLMDLDPGEIDMDLKRWPYIQVFLNMSNNVMGVDKDTLYYVISPD